MSQELLRTSDLFTVFAKDPLKLTVTLFFFPFFFWYTVLGRSHALQAKSTGQC